MTQTAWAAGVGEGWSAKHVADNMRGHVVVGLAVDAACWRVEGGRGGETRGRRGTRSTTWATLTWSGTGSSCEKKKKSASSSFAFIVSYKSSPQFARAYSCVSWTTKRNIFFIVAPNSGVLLIFVLHTRAFLSSYLHTHPLPSYLSLPRRR